MHQNQHIQYLSDGKNNDLHIKVHFKKYGFFSVVLYFKTQTAFCTHFSGPKDLKQIVKDEIYGDLQCVIDDIDFELKTSLKDAFKKRNSASRKLYRYSLLEEYA